MGLVRVIMALCVGALAAQGFAAGTDIIRGPSNWRGTLLEGTDAMIATNVYGEPLFVQSGETVAPLFAPAPIGGDRLAAEFKRLCIDTAFDDSKLSVAAGASGFSLANRKITIRSKNGGPPYEASIWYSPEARVQIWKGDLSALRNFQTLSRWRRGATSSPFNASRTLSPSCNVTVMATDFHDPQSFLATMATIIGVQPTKAVTKTEWADGYWSARDADGTETRISYSMVDFDKGEQLLQVSIGRIPSKK